MKIVYDPRHRDLLPGNSTLNFTISTVADSLRVDYTTVDDPLPAEPFYFLLDINFVLDRQGDREIIIDLINSESLQAVDQYPIPAEVLDRVAYGTALILLSRPYHGYPVEVMDKIVTAIINKHSTVPLNPSQFVFMLPATGKSAVPYLNIVDFTFFERMIGERRSQDNRQKIWQQRHIMQDKIQAPKHRFVCTNRRSNVFRMACTASLWDLRDRGLLTLLQDPTGQDYINQEISLQSVMYFPELTEKYINDVKPHLPLVWDVGFEAELSPTDCIAPDSDHFIDLMLDSMLCIVNETLMYDQPPQWHSEKTYKAISLMMPFIIIGQRHSLRALRDQGYRTFSPWINESYDNIEHAPDRLRAAMAEACRIIAMDDSAVASFLQEINAILAHNFLHFHSRYDSFDDDAVDKLQAILDKWTVDNP